jgi:hypothetical protein
MVPTLELPLPTPSTDQTSEGFVAFCTVAVNCCVKPTPNVEAAGVIDTDGGGLCTVTCALALLVESAMLVAVTV